MKRKAIIAGLLVFLLAAGCLLASCGKESMSEESSDVSSEGSRVLEASESASKEASSASSAETVSNASSEASSEASEASSEGSEVSSEASSENAEDLSEPPPTEEQPESPYTPPRLPGMDSPAPPAEVKALLPVKAEIYAPGAEPSERQTVLLTYEGNRLVIRVVTEYVEARDEYLFDDRGLLLERHTYGWMNQEQHTTYAYDENGRMTSYYEIFHVNEDDTRYEREEFFYNAQGELRRRVSSDLREDGTVYYTRTEDYLHVRNADGVLTQIVAYSGSISTVHRYENGLETECAYYLDGEDAPFRQYFYTYDAYGRLILSDGGEYTVTTYAENGNRSGKTSYFITTSGEPESDYSCKIVEWGEEAVTDLQKAFYRTAMEGIFGE